MQSEISRKELETIEEFTEIVPVKISSLARKLGLSIKLATLKPGISGEIRPDSDAESGYKIRINRHESKNRQRFTAAHEIAHFLLHRNLIGNGLEDSVLYRSRLSNRIEAQANGLAANILMPPDKVREQITLHPNLEDEELAEKLAEIFSVSVAAMKIRLGVD